MCLSMSAGIRTYHLVTVEPSLVSGNISSDDEIVIEGRIYEVRAGLA